MRRSMLFIWLLSGVFTLLQAQTYNCTDGSSVTINSLTLTSNVFGGCDVAVDLDVTVSTAGTWNWEVKLGAFTVLSGTEVLVVGVNNVVLAQAAPPPFNCTLLSGLTIAVSGPTGLGISCDDIPLPVELIDFKARPYQNGILLEWRTASELNNQGFDIQQSHDGQQWESIGFEKGRGNSTRVQKYVHLIKSVSDGDHYFRLKQMDEDGQYEYSPVIHTLIGRTGSELDVYPNPVRQGQGIAINGSFRELALFDSAGRQVRKISRILDQEDYLIDLSPGIYFLQGHLEEQMISKKLVVIR